jgi:hypothetical protein
MYDSTQARVLASTPAGKHSSTQENVHQKRLFASTTVSKYACTRSKTAPKYASTQTKHQACTQALWTKFRLHASIPAGKLAFTQERKHTFTPAQ